MLKICLVLLITVLANNSVCSQAKTGSIEKKDAALDAIINTNAKIEIIADGFEWSEGPLWIEQQQMLLFSDVPENIIYKWTARKGKEIYLTPSGYTGTVPRGGEKGSNGLTLNSKGQLVICQDGDRRMATMNAPLTKPAADFITVSNNYMGKKFNSPTTPSMTARATCFLQTHPMASKKTWMIR